MSPPPTHDPVSALAESEATGATAELFADIREAMAIPLVTSIWRVLAGVEGALPRTWRLAGPIVRSGQVDASRERVGSEVPWPTPAQPIRAGEWLRDREQVRAVVAAYTRSNTLSLLVLSALLAEAAGEPTSLAVPSPPGPWPPMPPLRARDQIDEHTWAQVERVNRIGSTPDQPGVATLWRHLAAWPSLPDAIGEGLASLAADGPYTEALGHTQDVVGLEAQRLAHLRPSGVALPDAARAVVEPYVTHPGLVQRMVVIGHIVDRWLGDGEVAR